ncbi:unnamed protein product [Clavelina lepadiformis]|uniref:Secreted protein n=1 Tax=Clavelina lepadiformis TaxID=159417 RepID=A0ABP0FR57_CLALP
MYDFTYFIYALGTVVVAGWLRRQTRNLLGPARHSCRGRVVKATDSKSVGPCPRRFESCRQRRYYFCNFKWIFGNVRFYLLHLCIKHSCRGGVVKATDSKSVGPCQRRFESRRQRRYYFCNFIWIFGNVAFYLFHLCIRHSCRGRVVKATDSKSVEPSPRTFKSRRQSRYYFCNFIWILHMHIHMNMKPGGEWRVLILQWENRRTSIDKLQVQTSEPQSDEPTTV